MYVTCVQGDWDSAKAVGTGEFEELEYGLVSTCNFSFKAQLFAVIQSLY